ncbi:MAG: AAA family ATPase, partial [Acidobacteriia bacterium]|nr:AAA family ATPase [Terriglobia bacterium]
YPPVAPPDAAERLAKLECFAAIQPKPLRWVWRDRIPAGKLSLMVGDPDKGKSLITIDITARITAGKPFPDGAPSERGSVIMLSAEDDPEDTIRPRLDAAGADVSRVHLLKAVRVLLRDGKQTERGFSLESDIDALYDAIKQTPDVRLIVIDPISAYLGAADSHNNSEVRGLLAPLAELAARTGVAILAVTHLRKSGGSAIYRAMGSIAFAAAARAVWGIAEDADDPDKRIMVRVKGNLAHDPGGLAYRIEVALDIPRIAWELGAVNLRADDVLGGLDSREERSEQREAEEWLKEFLAHGPKAVSEIRRQAPQAGLAWHTVRRAADALRIKKQKSGFVSGWEWALPEDAHPEGAHPCVSDMGTFEAAIENKGDTTQHSHEDAQPESVSTFGGVSSFEEGEL